MVKIEIETKPVSRPRQLITIAQASLTLTSLVCLGFLSSTQCWHHEPSEKEYLWWLTPSTVLVAAIDWLLEAFRADRLLTTAIDSVWAIFWIGGIGAAGQLNTLTRDLENCHGNRGPYHETGAITAFAVFEVILFALGAYHAWAGLPWPKSEDETCSCEAGNAQGGAVGLRVSASHLQLGDYSEYITINVGTGSAKRAFQVAKAPVCRRSSYIKSAVSAPWTAKLGIPAEAKEVDLSDDDPDVFKSYVRCVMENVVSVRELDIQNPKREQSDDVFLALFYLYVLEDKLGDPESMNLTIDCIARYCLAVHRVPNCEAVTYAFEYSVKSSPLRRLIADVFHLGYDREGTGEDHLDGMPNEFLVQYAQTNPDVQTVVPGSERYHQSITKQRVHRGLFRTISKSSKFEVDES